MASICSMPKPRNRGRPESPNNKVQVGIHILRFPGSGTENPVGSVLLATSWMAINPTARSKAARSIPS